MADVIYSIDSVTSADGELRGRQLAEEITCSCLSAQDALDDWQRLRFWAAFMSYMLAVAHSSMGSTQRDAIVEALRNAAATQARAGMMQ